MTRPRLWLVSCLSRLFELFTFALLLVCCPLVRAQMLDPVLSIGCRPYVPGQTCADAPPACAGPVHDVDLGPHEFVIHRVPLGGMGMHPMETVELVLHWPDSWPLVGYDICYGVLTSGDPSVEGSPLIFTFPNCPDEWQPFFRIRFDCTTPGTFGVGTPWEDARTCWGEQYSESMPIYVDIGDFCGAAPYTPCTQCGYHSPGGYFNPGSRDLTLPVGAVYSERLGVSGFYGPYCGGLPECGCDGFGSCFGGLDANVPWMTVELLDGIPGGGFQAMHYLMTIDAANLAIGTHEGRVIVHGGGCCCRETCMPVTVHIIPTSGVEPGAGAISHLLGPPTPNPMRGTLRFTVSMEGPGRASAMVLDAAGRVVAQLFHKDLPAGTTVHTWNPSEEMKGRLSAGVYFLAVETDAQRATRVFVLTK